MWPPQPLFSISWYRLRHPTAVTWRFRPKATMADDRDKGEHDPLTRLALLRRGGGTSLVFINVFRPVLRGRRAGTRPLPGQRAEHSANGPIRERPPAPSRPLDGDA